MLARKKKNALWIGTAKVLNEFIPKKLVIAFIE